MRIIVIRHGQSEADLMDVHEGRADFALTPSGMDQARRMSRYLCAQEHIDRIYASPLLRAQQTAAYLARAAQLDVETQLIYDEDLMEFDNGVLAGLPRQEAAARYPEVRDLPLHEAVYGQESQLHFRMRAERALSRVLAQNDPAATVAIVSHGVAINQLYRAFLRLPMDSDLTVHTGDTGIHLWVVEPHRRRIAYANRLEHLLEENAF